MPRYVYDRDDFSSSTTAVIGHQESHVDYDVTEAVLAVPQTIGSPRSKRLNRVSLITSRSLYNIDEPDALGLQLDEPTNEWSYQPYPTPSTEAPSLTFSSPPSSAGFSGRSTPEQPAAPLDQGIGYQKPQKERVGKAFLGKLKSLLLAPQSPASAKRDIKQVKAGSRRIRRAAPPAVEERSSSLYPAELEHVSDRRASVFCSGPYGNLAAYTNAFESTASVLPQAFASVADFRHYSTAELPLDPTVPYSPYAAAEYNRFSLLEAGSDLALNTETVKLKRKSGDWANKSKQFWSSALDLTSPRNKRASIMSTAELVSTAAVPPPIPARSRLRGPPSNANLVGAAKVDTPPMTRLPSSRSDLSGASAQNSVGAPVTPGTPPHLPPGAAQAYPSAAGPSQWPGKLDNPPTSPSNAERKRSRFSRGRHSSSGSVSLSASSDPLRVKDGVAPRGSTSGVYTPPTFPGTSRPPIQSHTSTSSAMSPARSASSSSEMSYSSASSASIPQTPTSPSAAASRMYTACIGALSGWSIGPAKRASHPPKVSQPQSPVHVDSGSMSASTAYFPTHDSRNSSFSQNSYRHQSSRSVSYNSTYSDAPVQVWSPESGWSTAAQQAGLGVGVQEDAHGRTRSTPQEHALGPAVIMADAPKGRRKPVPQVQGEEVHAI